MKEKINRSDRKKIFLRVLSEHFRFLGCSEYLEGDDPSYVLTESHVVITIGFNFLLNAEIVCGPLSVTHYDVEDYILNIGIPNTTLVVQKKMEKYHLATIHLARLPDSIQGRLLLTLNEIESFANSYIRFYETEGRAFIKRFETLPSILKEMDRLRSVGLYWNEILSGGPEHLIKGLIISKLCDDPGYLEKLEWIGGYFESKEDEWTPYWEQYKQVLKNITPKYNR